MHLKWWKIVRSIATAIYLLIVIVFLIGEGFAGNVKQVKLRNISPEEAKEIIQKNMGNPNFFLLDVRTKEEFKSAHLEGALNLDYYSPNFGEELENLYEEGIYLVYCRSGNRSMRAVDMMKTMGFKTLYNLSGGITSWKAKGYPVVNE